MKRFSFVMLAVAAAVCAVCWLGCGEGDNGNPADNSGNNSNNSGNNNGNGNNNNGGDANHDGRLINADNEAWLQGNSCESATGGLVFESNGDVTRRARHSGVWVLDRFGGTWRTDGNKLTINIHGGEEQQIVTYEISNGTLTLTDDSNRATYKKCSGVVVGG